MFQSRKPGKLNCSEDMINVIYSIYTVLAFRATEDTIHSFAIYFLNYETENFISCVSVWHNYFNFWLGLLLYSRKSHQNQRRLAFGFCHSRWSLMRVRFKDSCNMYTKLFYVGITHVFAQWGYENKLQ